MADASHSSLLAGLETGDIKVKNSRGSSAGAGSGDCHHYLQARRAELFRLERLQDESDKAKKDKEWEDQMKERLEASEAEKAKKAEKRNKKKLKRKAAQEEAKQEKNTKKQKLAEESDESVHTLPKPSTSEEKTIDAAEIKIDPKDAKQSDSD